MERAGVCAGARNLESHTCQVCFPVVPLAVLGAFGASQPQLQQGSGRLWG